MGLFDHLVVGLLPGFEGIDKKKNAKNEDKSSDPKCVNPKTWDSLDIQTRRKLRVKGYYRGEPEDFK